MARKADNLKGGSQEGQTVRKAGSKKGGQFKRWAVIKAVGWKGKLKRVLGEHSLYVAGLGGAQPICGGSWGGTAYKCVLAAEPQGLHGSVRPPQTDN